MLTSLLILIAMLALGLIQNETILVIMYIITPVAFIVWALELYRGERDWTLQ